MTTPHPLTEVEVTQADRERVAEHCPEPRPHGCVQQPTLMSNAGFVLWRCSNCGSESWT